MSALPPRVVIATGNADKRREWRRLLAGLAEPLERDLPSPVEDGATCRENAVIKAAAAWRATELPCLADDVGLEVEALGGLPGIELRRWADALGGWEVAKRALAEVSGSPATYVCGLALADGGGVRAVEVRVPGTVTAPRGEGPGVEPCFVPRGSRRTLAELPWEERLAVHHRALALRALLSG